MDVVKFPYFVETYHQGMIFHCAIVPAVDVMIVADLLNEWSHGVHVMTGDPAFRSDVCESSPHTIWSAPLMTFALVKVVPFGHNHDRSDTYPHADICRLRNPCTAVGFPGVSQVRWTVVP